MPRKHVVIAVMALLVSGHEGVARAQSRWVEVSGPTLVARGASYAVVYTLAAQGSKDPIWAEVEVNNADGSRRCEWLKKLEGKQVVRFECPVTGAVGDKVPSRVRVFKDEKLEDRELFRDPELNVTAAVLATAEKEGAALAAGVAIAPDGVIDAPGMPVPSTFKPTWYRRIDRGFAMRAYENSGDLTVESDALVFVDGKKTVRIPYSQITSVRWEPMPNDIANHWVAVRFTNDEGKPDGVAFRDGGMLGNRQGTGKIYVTLHRAAKK